MFPDRWIIFPYLAQKWLSLGIDQAGKIRGQIIQKHAIAELPLAENTRRNIGLRFDRLIAALQALMSAPNWTALTVSEVNPDHGEADGATLRVFAQALAGALVASLRLTALNRAGSAGQSATQPQSAAQRRPD